jgi:hypothetical protein
MLKFVFPVVLTSGISLLPNCSQFFPDNRGCTQVYVYGVNVTLTDAETGEPITGATLTLRDGDYVEVLEAFPTGDGEYAGAGERAGTYELTIAKVGYETQVIEDIVVTADECHVEGVHLDIELVPLK